MQPVLEIRGPDDFDLWPVADVPPYTFLPLGGGLGPAEVGTAVMAVAACNDVEPEAHEPPRPADPVRGYLHGLLTLDPLFASGGLRVTDTASGVTLVPGCCNGLDERDDWQLVVDGDSAGFGHHPSPLAERLGDTVRLTVDVDTADSPRIELPVTELRRLLATAEQDLLAFHGLAATWCTTQLPGYATELSDVLARALAVDPNPPHK